MAELREDPISGRWVIMAAERAARPHDFHVGRGERSEGFCPFCEGNEGTTPPEIEAVRPLGGRQNSAGWKVRVVPNKYPALRLDGMPTAHGGWHQHTVQGVGVHEVIIESPHHIVSPSEMTTEDYALVVETYCRRTRELIADQRLAYVLIFKNVGDAAGASLDHTHSQIMAVPVMPKLVSEELRRCEEFHSYRSRCLLCDILEEELGSGERVVAESDSFVVLSPFAAAFPFEMWVLPKFHAPRMVELSKCQTLELAGLMRESIARLEVCLNDPPYNMALHSAPRAVAEQSYHWHMEVVPRVTHVAGFEWGTGFYINPMEPERATEHLRQVDEKRLKGKLKVDYAAANEPDQSG